MGREKNDGVEKDNQTRIMNEATKLGLNLWRNNTGLFLTLDGKRKVKVGLGAGSGASDLIGIMPTKITQSMVGQTVGIFLAIEVKKQVNGKISKTTPEQDDFIKMVNTLGGVAGVCVNSDDFLKLLNNTLDFKSK